MSEAAENTTELKSDRGVLVLKQTLGSDILQSLFQFVKLTELHDPSNEVFKKATSDILKTLQTWISIPEFGKLQFGLSGDQIFFNGVRIRPKPRYIDKIHYLLSFLRKRRLIGFTVDKSPSASNLETFMWCLVKTTSKTTAHLQEDLKAKGLTEFKIESLIWKDTGDSHEVKSLASEIYVQFLEFVKIVFEDFNRAVLMKPPALGGMFDNLQTIDESDLVNLFCLRAIKRAEKPLPQIAVNTSFMLFAWARSLGLPPGVFAELAGAGLAHPLVLVNSMKGMSRDIRDFERSSLSLSNLQRMKHIWPLTELQWLAILEWSIPFGNNGVYVLAGQQCYQHFFSRMLRIVALFQQLLVLDHEATPESVIMKLLKAEMGCDQTLVRLFIHWLGVYPLGSFVLLNSGETAQVCSLENNLLSSKRPNVSVYKDKDGNLLDVPKLVDLNQLEGEEYAFGIQQSITAEKAAVPEEKIALFNSLSLSLTN